MKMWIFHLTRKKRRFNFLIVVFVAFGLFNMLPNVTGANQPTRSKYYPKKHERNPMAVSATDVSYATYFPMRRLMGDTSAISFEAIAKGTNECWVVAEFKPRPIFWPPANATMDADGNITPGPPENEKPVLQDGTCRILVTLTGTIAKDEEFYRWTPHHQESFSGYEGGMPRDPKAFHEASAEYSPLREGGVALCRINDGKEGSERFRPLYAIPTEWVPLAAPALTFFREHDGLFVTAHAVQQQKELVALLSHENPFVAIAACRALTKARLLTPEIRKIAILSGAGLRQASMVYAIWRYLEATSRAALSQAIETGNRKFVPPPDHREQLAEEIRSRKALVQQLCQIADASDSAEKIWGMAFAALEFSPDSKVTILKTLALKAKAWSVNSQAERNIDWILESTKNSMPRPATK